MVILIVMDVVVMDSVGHVVVIVELVCCWFLFVFVLGLSPWYKTVKRDFRFYFNSFFTRNVKKFKLLFWLFWLVSLFSTFFDCWGLLVWVLVRILWWISWSMLWGIWCMDMIWYEYDDDGIGDDMVTIWVMDMLWWIFWDVVMVCFYLYLVCRHCTKQSKEIFDFSRTVLP